MPNGSAVSQAIACLLLLDAGWILVSVSSDQQASLGIKAMYDDNTVLVATQSRSTTDLDHPIGCEDSMQSLVTPQLDAGHGLLALLDRLLGVRLDLTIDRGRQGRLIDTVARVVQR